MQDFISVFFTSTSNDDRIEHAVLSTVASLGSSNVYPLSLLQELWSEPMSAPGYVLVCLMQFLYC